METNAYNSSSVQVILNNINNPDAPHDSMQNYIRNLNIGFIVVVCLVIGLRTGVRAKLIKHMSIEDHLMITAGIAAIAFFAMNILGLNYGFGRHIWDLPLTSLLEKAKKAVQTLFICQLLYSTAIALVKLSIVSTYWRIFPQLWMRHVLSALSFFLLAVWAITTFTTIFQCHPVQGAWDFTIPKKCIRIKDVYYFATAFSAVTDVVLCVLPIPLFWKLKLPKKEKWIVSSLFMFGLFAAAASILRCVALKNLDKIDVTMEAMAPLNWSVGEVSTGIICACIPPLKPLFKKLFPGRFFTSFHTRSHNNDVIRRSTIGAPIQKVAHLPKTAQWRRRNDPWYQTTEDSEDVHWIQETEMSRISKTPT